MRDEETGERAKEKEFARTVSATVRHQGLGWYRRRLGGKRHAMKGVDGRVG
jgi:hypothetical protein